MKMAFNMAATAGFEFAKKMFIAYIIGKIVKVILIITLIVLAIVGVRHIWRRMGFVIGRIKTDTSTKPKGIFRHKG